jgi:hypothetical protein
VLARYRLELITAGVAAVLGAAYLLLPPMGSDLSAQVARAAFFADHGYTPVDLRWYAGVDQLGYSLVSQPVMAFLGVRVTGVLSVLVASVLFGTLLRRTRAAHQRTGALVGAVCIAGNLVSGRVTYALGVAFALGALVLLTHPRWRWFAVLPVLLASATSPVAGLFAGLAGAALLLSGRWRDGLLLAVPAAIPVGASALFFGDGGWMNISHMDTARALVTSLAVAVLVPQRPVRIGALLSAAGVLAASIVHTPVGLNATRLSVMFTLPVLAAYAALPRRTHTAGPGGAHADPERRLPLGAVIVLLIPACWWQQPVVLADLRDIGNPTTDRAYFTPLADRLGQETLTGRVEIPPTRDYWEAAYLGEVPLARGWLRQADIDRNPLFFESVPGTKGTGVALTADSYRAWLSELAVQFVAVPDAEPTWSGRGEAVLVTGGLPYLTEIWRNDHWRLYRVSDPQPIVAAPATLTGQNATSVTFTAEAAGNVVLRVRHYRWLRATGGAVVQSSGPWTLVRVPDAGRYTLYS